jgi:hypothetical protein
VPSVVVTGAALVALLVPLGFGLSRPAQRPIGPNHPTLAPLPEVIAQLQQRDVATIVEFVDFECPFCRRQQEALAPVLASFGPRVRVIRKNVPLSFHEHARDAARAACCAEEQGRGEAVAAALFVGVERFEGLTDADTLRASIERALRGGGADAARHAPQGG